MLVGLLISNGPGVDLGSGCQGRGFGGRATDQEGWGVWLKAAGAKTVDPGRGLQLDTSLAAFEMAINGAGVALGRKSLSGTVESSGRLVAPFDLEVPIDEAFHLIAPIAPGGHPDAEIFVEWITSVADKGR
ncbi:hypothetical protein I6F15_27830 [Bradyrhizobium sp. BRP14]|nr:hypothetical protein [Bradyrhizobium sp. BRP14]